MMPDTIWIEDLLDFLQRAEKRGLMPAATARALAVASRNVFSVLDSNERAALAITDVDAVFERFINKRGDDFTPESLKEYGRRVRRAVDLYVQWRDDPANFSVKTRSTHASPQQRVAEPARGTAEQPSMPAAGSAGYQTAFPIRPGHVVTITNVPHDLTTEEAKRLGQFITLLATA